MVAAGVRGQSSGTRHTSSANCYLFCISRMAVRLRGVAKCQREGTLWPCSRRVRPYTMLDDAKMEKSPAEPCSMAYIRRALCKSIARRPGARETLSRPCSTYRSRAKAAGAVLDDHYPSSTIQGLCSTIARQKSQAEGCARRLPVGKVAATPCSAPSFQKSWLFTGA